VLPDRDHQRHGGLVGRDQHPVRRGAPDKGLAFNAAGATGDIRIGAHTLDGAFNVLAHGFYPPPNGTSAAGDLHFDAAEPWACTPGAGLIDIGIVALHELGHVLGLGHEPRSQRFAVMNPFYNPSVASVLLGDDVDGGINIYGSSTGATDDLVVNFGAGVGLWRYDYGRPWSQLHSVSPQDVVVGDLDGNGIQDLIVNFGSAAGGVWVYRNKATWFPLNSLAPAHMAVGDLDGNGLDDVILSFAGRGVWIWYNSASWVQLHQLDPSLMAVGNIDGAAGADLILDFPGQGVWTFRNNAIWSRIHALDASLIATGHLDTAAQFPVEPQSGVTGMDDIIIAFPGQGLYAHLNNATWWLIHPLTPVRVAVGDLDLDGRDDLTIDFGSGIGLWTLTNGTAWAQLHSLSSEAIAMGDLDGNGQDEIIVDFGTGIGVWIRMNNSSWVQLHTLSPVGFNVADLN
jgi:hypothetical protein